MQSKHLKTFGIVLMLMVLGTMLLAACGRDGSSGNTPDTPNTVHMNDANFVQTTITIKKGSSLNLVNDSSTPHIIQNGTWNNGTAEAKQESGAPKVDLNFSGSGSQSTGPFTTAGTFKLYCTVHPGMNLTVIVE